MECQKDYGLDNQQLSPDEGQVQRLLPEMVLGQVPETEAI